MFAASPPSSVTCKFWSPWSRWRLLCSLLTLGALLVEWSRRFEAFAYRHAFELGFEGDPILLSTHFDLGIL